GSIPVSAGACRRPALMSVNLAPVWHVAHVPAPVNTARPRAAAAASKLPGGGAGALRLSWYARSAASFGVTRSGDCTTDTPSRGSLNEPWPCICVTATYAFQYETGLSAV